MDKKRDRVCPVKRAGLLDNKIRRWLQNPVKILKPYVKEGMTVLDIGCGPGFFSIEMAGMVGKSGRVIASDLQEGMLQKLENKIKGTAFQEQIRLHRSEKNRIGVSEKVDFILAFYVVHELPDKEKFFNEIRAILKPDGQVLLVEPSFHVSKKAFEETIRKAEKAGLRPLQGPKVFLSKAVLLRPLNN